MLGMVGPDPMEDCEIRMYKNGYGDQAPSLDRGWIMGHWRPGSTYTPTTNGMDIFEIANQVVTYPSGQLWNTYLYLDIDTKPIPLRLRFARLWNHARRPIASRLDGTFDRNRATFQHGCCKRACRPKWLGWKHT